MALVVGLTGGIGSGKSAAAEEFARLGATVVDTDAIAHELTQAGGAAIAQMRRLFGDDFVDADRRHGPRQDARAGLSRSRGEAASSSSCCTR